MSIVQLNPVPSTATEAARPPLRAAGLFKAPKGHMTPCLAFVAFFLVVDVVACVVRRVPATDHPAPHPQGRPAVLRLSAPHVTWRAFVVSIPTRGPPLPA